MKRKEAPQMIPGMTRMSQSVAPVLGGELGDGTGGGER
jgi:hypothetical protein